MKPLTPLDCLIRTLAALGAFMVLSSCAVAGSPALGTLQANSSAPVVSTYNLNGFVITTTVFAPEYNSAKVEVSLDSQYYASSLLGEGLDQFNLSNRGKDYSFSLDLIFAPASGLCQQGGLYLRSGSLKARKDGPTINYMNLALAAWNSAGQLIEPWLTPFDQPVPVEQSSVQQWKNGDPSSSLGLWTYEVVYRSPVVPPSDCLVMTKLELKLTSADEAIPARIYHYIVMEKNRWGRVDAGISVLELNAPKANIEYDESGAPEPIRRLTFKGLDVLRDAKAQIVLSFDDPPQALLSSASFPSPIRPLINIETAVDITAGYPPAPLATHLARIFSELTAPLLAVSGTLTPTIPVKISTSLSTPQASGLPMIRPLTPLLDSTLTPGKDDCSNFTQALKPGLSCTLATYMEKAASALGPLDPAASYLLDISLHGGAEKTVQPFLRLLRVIVPLAKVGK